MQIPTSTRTKYVGVLFEKLFMPYALEFETKNPVREVLKTYNFYHTLRLSIRFTVIQIRGLTIETFQNPIE